MRDRSFYIRLKGRSYYKRNLEKTNNLVSAALFAAALMGVGFAAGTFFKLFNISYIHCLVIFLLGLSFSFTQYLLNKIHNLQKITKYIGLLFIAIFISFVAIVPGVGLSIYISFILVSFISTLYLSIKLSLISSLLSYVLMVSSLYINSHFNIFFKSEPKIATQLFLGEFFGYSFAYLFVFAITLAVSHVFNETLELELQKQNRIKELKYDLIETFAHIIEWSDKYTGQHIQRTRRYVEIISKRLVDMNYYTDELTPTKIKLLVDAAPLHDIGKINVPNNILSKPGKFTDDEYEIMKTHSKTGYNIIINELSRFEDINYVQIASQMALYHHERWDGTGYPNKVKGTEIPLCGRIMAAADVLDALLSKRQYKNEFTIEQTFKIFEEQRNKQFESCIVDAVFSLKDEILDIATSD